MSREFERRLRKMRSRDAATAEEGFQDLLAHVEQHTGDLIAAFHAELASPEPDHAMACWLLELIGESRSEAAMPTLAEQLYSRDPSLHSWAVGALEKLDSKQARTELWKAKASGILHERLGK